MIQASIPATVALKNFDYNVEVEIVNHVADTVATTFQGAEVDLYIKADDIVLKNIKQSSVLDIISHKIRIYKKK